MNITPTIRQQIDDMLATLSPQGQEKALAFVRAIVAAEQNGSAVSGQELLDFFDQYPLTPDEAAELNRIYEEIDE